MTVQTLTTAGFTALCLFLLAAVWVLARPIPGQRKRAETIRRLGRLLAALERRMARLRQRATATPAGATEEIHTCAKAQRPLAGLSARRTHARSSPKLLDRTTTSGGAPANRPNKTLAVSTAPPGATMGVRGAHTCILPAGIAPRAMPASIERSNDMATFRGSNHQISASSVYTNGDLANLIDNLFRQRSGPAPNGDYARGLYDMAQSIADATNTEIALPPSLLSAQATPPVRRRRTL